MLIILVRVKVLTFSTTLNNHSFKIFTSQLNTGNVGIIQPNKLLSAPEILAEEPAFPQSDIWSVGVLTYVMLSGTVPFRGENQNESRQNILFVRYRFEHLYQEVSQEATRFLMLLFKRHPK